MPNYMWSNTTKGTSCLLLNKLRFLQYLTEDLTRFPMIPENWKFKWYFGNTTFTSIFPLRLYFLLFSLYFVHYFVHYLRINLAYKMYLLLYWITYIMSIKLIHFAMPTFTCFDNISFWFQLLSLYSSSTTMFHNSGTTSPHTTGNVATRSSKNPPRPTPLSRSTCPNRGWLGSA